MKVLFLESLPYESAFRVGSHHYAEAFLHHGWAGMWLSHPISPLHLLHPVKRDFGVRMEAWRRGVRDYGAMAYYSPMTLLPTASVPLLRSRLAARTSVRLTVPTVGSALSARGFESPDVLWLTNPIYQPLAERIAARCRVVRVADDTAAFEGTPDSVRELESAAIDGADIVFAVAESTQKRLSLTHDNVVRLPNGVDLCHFAVIAQEPPALTRIPHPRVLYVGSMEYWFDARLLAECARSLPEASFVLVGPPSAAVQRVAAELENVHVMGPVDYDVVPALMHHCDVAIVPFARSPMVDAIHPIKVYEYLAAGLPVVAVRWPELEAMVAPVELVERPGFAQRLQSVLASDPAVGRDERVAYARRNSWDVRFEVVLREVNAVLDGTVKR